jgi:hypothetical protein
MFLLWDNAAFMWRDESKKSLLAQAFELTSNHFDRD